jgi:SAM-dependent methyltransferase
VAHHYDLSSELYRLFLDPDRQYSCAYFPQPTTSLDEAQLLKKRHIAAKLLLRPGQRVLDIGCGWGGLGIYCAQVDDVDVTGLTLSVEQHDHAMRRVREAGLEDRVRFLIQDYRETTGSFDRIVSVGMLEHVGVNHYDAYFRRSPTGWPRTGLRWSIRSAGRRGRRRPPPSSASTSSRAATSRPSPRSCRQSSGPGSGSPTSRFCACTMPLTLKPLARALRRPLGRGGRAL